MLALPPGSTIGILGGGQLARMLALSAAKLGLKAHIYAPEKDCPAYDVAAAHTIARYGNRKTLVQFAKTVDVVTYEFENVPVEAVQFLETIVPVRPSAHALGVAQDRLKEKALARELGALTADYRPVNSLVELENAVIAVGLPAILKTTRMGYDGRGQAKISSLNDVPLAFAAMNGDAAILESFVLFDAEISVICARGIDGQFTAYDVVQNVHRDHILHTATVPAAVDPVLAIEAVFVAQRMAEALSYVGVLAVEFFVGEDVLYLNEIAPRVHNSGHWTMDACTISQFEQHIRAVAGWPLGSTLRHSDAVMTNLLGDETAGWKQLASTAGAGLHLYGKAQARTGRKMGHFNVIKPRIAPRQA